MPILGFWDLGVLLAKSGRMAPRQKLRPSDLAKSTPPSAPAAAPDGYVRLKEEAEKEENLLRPTMRFGEQLSLNPQLKPLMQRESFFLTKLIPRKLTWATALPVAWSQLTRPRIVFISICLTLYGTTARFCVSLPPGTDSICNDVDAMGDLRSGMLTSLATLLLSFYTSNAVSLYMAAYDKAQLAKNSTITLVNLGVGTIVRDGDEREARARELLLDLWRCVNLMHLATYVVADKSRQVYSSETFLLPVAASYGPHDAEMVGMLRRDEADQFMRGIMKLRAAQARAHTVAAGDASLVDLRGDVRSDVAMLYSAFQARLYRIVGELIDNKLTSAPWPTWGAALLNLSEATLGLQRRALYRMNKVYETSIIAVVLSTLLFDSFVLGQIVGQHWVDWAEHAWLTTTLATLLLLSAVFFVTLIVGTCIHMEEPFGKDPMDLPGLSYVTATAETTLRLLVPQGSPTDPMNRVANANASQLGIRIGSDLYQRGRGSVTTRNPTPPNAVQALKRDGCCQPQA